MSAKKLCRELGLAATLALGGAMPAAALVIDDWNVTTGAFVDDNTADGTGVVNATRGTGGTSLPRGRIFANLVSGAQTGTHDCPDSCQHGHFLNAAGSQGHGFWEWLPASLNLTGAVKLDVSTDVANADMILSFGSGGTLLGEIWWKDLADTNGATTTLIAALPAGLTGIDRIVLDVFSVGGSYADPDGWLGARDYGLAAMALNLKVDNLTVPEPGSVALLGLGLAGLAALRRRVR